MKLRATNLTIGLLTLAVIGAGLAGVLIRQKIHAVAQRSPLRIVFDGSTSGLRKGGSVNFDGVQVGEVVSLTLQNPRSIVVETTVENSAPIRQDTLVGVEFQGLTGIAAISLTGGEAAAPPPPLDADGVPTLHADLTETVTVRETLQNVDRMIVSNQAAIRDALSGFQDSTAALVTKADAIDGVMRKADTAADSFDRAIAKIDSAIAKVDDVMPSLTSGGNELYQSVKSMHELVASFNKRSAAFMNEGRRSLLDISEAANKVQRKFNTQSGR
jgi:phospholipid/cholesterol/gamma-HCH transport system substrate-binding protein